MRSSALTGGMRCFSSIRSMVESPEIARQALRLDQRHAVAGRTRIESELAVLAFGQVLDLVVVRRRLALVGINGGRRHLGRRRHVDILVLAQFAGAVEGEQQERRRQADDGGVYDIDLAQDSTSSRIRLIGLAP